MPGLNETSESEEENPITLLDEDIGDYKVWQVLAGSAVLLFVLFFMKRKPSGGDK